MKSPSLDRLTKIIFTLSLLSLSSLAFSAQVVFSTATNFGTVNVGSTKDITFTAKNTSSKKVRLDSYWFNNSNLFTLSGGTCKYAGWNLNAGASCTVILRFKPTTSGTFNATFSLGYFLGTSWTWAESYLALNGTGNAVVVAPNPTPLLSWLKVVGNQIQNPAGQQVILKGVNIADPEHLNIKTWERPNVTARSVASLATNTYFAEVVRLPILPGDPAYPNEGFFSATNGYDVYFNNHILPVVTDLTSKGIFVIIDLHYISDYQNLYPQVESFWKYMAPKFANNPYVIYEIFNEPINPNDWTTWKNTIAQPAVNLIRTYAPNNLIFVGGPYWSSNMIGAVSDPIAGSNLVYIAHVYSNQTPAMWDSRYGQLAAQYPLFITEWGFETGGSEGGDINYGKQFESWMRTRNLGWTAWTFDTVWGPKMFNSDWTLKDSPGGEGVFIKDLLLEKHLSKPLQ